VPTVQLRRYRIAEGELDGFVAWFGRAARTRTPFGFTVEFAYLDRSAGEFVWAVSHPGDDRAFDEAEATWRADPARAAVFAEMPDCITDHHVAKVERVTDLVSTPPSGTES
jgi:hypothetical protein